MAAFEPFQPAKGATQSIAVGAGAATSQTIQFNVTGENPTLLATFAGATAGTALYVRMTVEVSTSIVATSGDCPMVAGADPTVRLFASPNAFGVYNVAVVVTATPAAAGTVWFTPGQGGVT